MDFLPQTRFSMCSLYSRDDRALCACFLGKDDRVVEDLVALHSEALLWSGAGSGVISLADLEAELKGKRAWDRQGRDDLGFLKACHECGLKVFGVVFTAQGYEVAVELTPDESEIISFGKVLGKGKRGTWGLNEFLSGPLSKNLQKFSELSFPERRAKMEKALAGRAFLDQAACQDLQGDKSRCYWVTSSGLEHDLNYASYFMCKNSPVWQEHLKIIIETQIDAGFDGIQFDEPGLRLRWAGPGPVSAGIARKNSGATWLNATEKNSSTLIIPRCSGKKGPGSCPSWPISRACLTGGTGNGRCCLTRNRIFLSWLILCPRLCKKSGQGNPGCG